MYVQPTKVEEALLPMTSSPVRFCERKLAARDVDGVFSSVDISVLSVSRSYTGFENVVDPGSEEAIWCMLYSIG
ncbi:unnamed protein product [Heligmosomoides polygyrus]|uniref:Uncharacterized protein n=1 Tax=Heligmosomoides polygyrus TaxID=6339 RepID=A0A183F8K0_HELPZ|nr:unnamed protein product [Heligmosomoides polygyrus]